MPIVVENGIDIGPGITIGGSAGPVLSNLTMYLNANDSASYPGTGTTWFDISGNGANIALNNSPTFTAGSPAYFTFNGSNQYGIGSTNGVLDNTQYTKSVWFYLNGYNDNNFSSSQAGGHFMYMASTNKVYCGHTDWVNYGAYPSTATFSLSTWYYIALTFDTTVGMTLYINGVQDSTYTANKSAFTGNGSTNVATFDGSGNYLNGRISQAFFYNKRLSGAEVLQNYNSTKALYGY